MNLEYRRADLSDLEYLTKVRLQVLRAANRLPDAADMSEIERETFDYYRNCLPDGSHVAYLVFDRDILAGAGGISFYRVMPTCSNPTGEKAYIMNMYTSPDYRRRGIARHTLDLLVREAFLKKVSFITLEATKMGFSLYTGYGFQLMEHEMILPESLLYSKFS